MSNAETPRSERKRAYEAVVETVRQQTGPNQGWHVPTRHVRVTCCANGSLDPARYETALQAAIDNRDLVSWHGRLIHADLSTLRDAVNAEAQSQHPRRGFIATLNQAIDHLDGGDA